MEMVKIGDHMIEFPTGHGLKEIYVNRPTYDFGPWNLIGEIITKNNLLSLPLIDIGANVGDSIAHFVRIGGRNALGIEAAKDFYEISDRNLNRIGTGKVINALVQPQSLIGMTSFVSGAMTGTTTIATDSIAPWRGKSVTVADLSA
jgi:hypothetical protein